MDPRYHEMASQNELAIILSNYESNFVCDVVKDHIERVKKMSITSINTLPNVVDAWEANFKVIKTNYPGETARIEEVRSETYVEVIDEICKAYNLSFTTEQTDLYFAASTLYEFFVCNMARNISLFFANFIFRNRDELYESMNLSESRKNKDSSTLYGKKVYKDIKLAVVNANIIKIVDNIAQSMEFSLNSFISTIIDMSDKAAYISSLVSENGNFFKETVIIMVNGNLAEYITDIRLIIQNIALAQNQIIYNSENTVEGENENI